MRRALKALAASGMIVGIRGKSALALPGVSEGMGFIASNKSMHLVRARPQLPQLVLCCVARGWRSRRHYSGVAAIRPRTAAHCVRSVDRLGNLAHRVIPDLSGVPIDGRIYDLRAARHQVPISHMQSRVASASPADEEAKLGRWASRLRFCACE